MWDLGRLEEGLESMNRSFELLSQDEPDADLASLAAQLGRFLFFGGQRELGAQRIEAALDDRRRPATARRCSRRP